MNYIGSKYSLLVEIAQILDDHAVSGEGTALDLFAGTGAVAQLLKSRGHVVYANDWQYYAYVTNVALIGLNDYPEFSTLFRDDFWSKAIAAVPLADVRAFSIHQRGVPVGAHPCAQVLSYLNALPGHFGPFFDGYCEGGRAGRMYFSQDNGLRIQAIRDQIDRWADDGLIGEAEKAWLVACLVESADRVANTASVYGAYLKRIKATARKPLQLIALRPVGSPYPAERHRVFCEDGLALLRRLADERLRLVYIDPPYNHRQYAANYHLLETIARWDLDRFAPRGVTGLRNADEQRSDYSLRDRAAQAFRRLFEVMHADFVLFSYNNEGLLSEAQLRGLFDEFCSQVDFRRIPFKRFRADIDRENRTYKADHTHEFLILGRLGAGG